MLTAGCWLQSELLTYEQLLAQRTTSDLVVQMDPTLMSSLPSPHCLLAIHPSPLLLLLLLSLVTVSFLCQVVETTSTTPNLILLVGCSSLLDIAQHTDTHNTHQAM